MTIRERRDKLDADFAALQEAAKALEAECLHPKFKAALSMVACVHPVQMCEDCYFTKPVDYTIGVDFATGIDRSMYSQYQIFDELGHD